MDRKDIINQNIIIKSELFVSDLTGIKGYQFSGMPSFAFLLKFQYLGLGLAADNGK